MEKASHESQRRSLGAAFHLAIFFNWEFEQRPSNSNEALQIFHRPRLIPCLAPLVDGPQLLDRACGFGLASGLQLALQSLSANSGYE
jgi:hypothetical protein